MDSTLIDTTAALVAFLDGLGDCNDQSPNLYLDLEGNNLSRNGTVALITILVKTQHHVFLVDVATLKEEAFDTSGSGKRTLRAILEAEDIVKVFFDIRNDSDALFALYGVRVAGIEDLQLMELASRDYSRRCVSGLAKCIERDSAVAYTAKRNWQNGKDRGRKLFDPAQGGSYAVFDRRPMDADVMDYCVQDVALMPNLREVYRAKLWDEAWARIGEETKSRIRLSQSASFNGKGRHMALGPPAWSNWSFSRAEKAERTMF